MTDLHRKPQAFVLPDQHDDQDGDKAKPLKAKRRTVAPTLVFDAEPEHTELVTVPQTTSTASPRRFRWAGLLVSALFALFSMWATLSIVQLVESFFARSPWLGWLALGVAAVAALAAIAIIFREIFGLFRLRKIELVQEQAARAINLDERTSAEAACTALENIYANRADVKWGLQQFISHRNDILDPRDRMHLADSLLLQPLDAAAHKIIARRARRVTLLTTVTPAAVLDILFVAAQNLAMLRELATLYGGRPSTLATLKLARMVATHLAVTGGLALSDNLIQHFVGKGLLGKLSARFGEGAVNGILTSRIGLAACAVCRPIPRQANTSDTLTSLLKEVMTFGNQKPEPENRHGQD
jgi:putative membrane protein